MDTIELPPELRPDPKFDEMVMAPVKKIGELSAEIADRLQSDLGLAKISAAIPRLLQAHGADFNAEASLNVANGSNLIVTGVLTGIVVKAGGMITDKESMIEMSPCLVELAKVLVRANAEQGKIRVSLAKAGMRREELRNEISKVRSHPTSFKPGQVVTLDPIPDTVSPV